MTKLSATSALVLLWGDHKSYKSECAKDYLSQLDLSEGRSLYEQCENICPYYAEVIKNRKYGVLHLVKQVIDNENKLFQVIIAGAGLDALGIEIAGNYPNTNLFELDCDNMNLKSKLHGNIKAKTRSNIVFIEADLLNTPSVHKLLIAAGWSSLKPTLLIMEGVSYYLSEKSIANLVEKIKPNWTIFEFLKQDSTVADDKLSIANSIFGLISSDCNLTSIHKYDYSMIENFIDNMIITNKLNMKDLEQKRTGHNKFFPKEASGWIDICLLEKLPKKTKI